MKKRVRSTVALDLEFESDFSARGVENVPIERDIWIDVARVGPYRRERTRARDRRGRREVDAAVLTNVVARAVAHTVLTQAPGQRSISSDINRNTDSIQPNLSNGNIIRKSMT